MGWLDEGIRILVALGSIPEQFVGADDPKFRGEYVAASVTSASGDLSAIGVIAARRYARKAGRGRISDAAITTIVNDKWAATLETLAAGKKLPGFQADSATNNWARANELKTNEIRAAVAQAKSDEANAARIIGWTIAIVELLELTTGFEPPVDGADFDAGSELFTALGGQLGSALPDSTWQGEAACVYAGSVRAQQKLAWTMRSCDSALAILVSDQAAFNTHIRVGLGAEKHLLVLALAAEVGIAWKMGAPVGTTLAKEFAMAIAMLGIVVASVLLFALLRKVELTDAEAIKLAGYYRDTVVLTPTALDHNAIPALSNGAATGAPAAPQHRQPGTAYHGHGPQPAPLDTTAQATPAPTPAAAPPPHAPTRPSPTQATTRPIQHKPASAHPKHGPDKSANHRHHQSPNQPVSPTSARRAWNPAGERTVGHSDSTVTTS